MKYTELKERLSQNMFTFLDVQKLFPEEKLPGLRTQLYRLVKKNLLVALKRGLYCFDPEKIEDFVLANMLQTPSYVSLESALNYYGVIPDVVLTVTSVGLVKPQKVSCPVGNFIYVKIKPDLYFGYQKVKSFSSDDYFDIADKEKALLDYFYFRKLKSIQGLRLKLEDLDKKFYHRYASAFPKWVQKIRLYE